MARSALVPTDAELAIGHLMEEVQSLKEKNREPTPEEKLRDTINHLLGQLGAKITSEDKLRFEGTEFILPASYSGNIPKAIDYLRNLENEAKKQFSFNKTFRYRPYDGAYAFIQVMKQLTGTSGLGVDRVTMFGKEPPEFVSINVSPTETVQVPWGQIAFPTYEATFDVGYTTDEYGFVSHISVTAPRKFRGHIEAIFGLIERYLKENSIYRGKAINGHNLSPEFIDLSRVDERKVVYSQSVLRQLSANVWAPIRYSERFRSQGIPLKRAVLFAGPFGTGKTLGAMLTAKEAVENGWTFIMCRTGKDDPAEVMKTAELYAPAVVVIEDIDVHAGTSTKVEISRLLVMLDGVVNKGNEVIGLFTTNHIEEIQKGALRPGRIDAVIEIDDLDEPGFRKLITLTLGDEWLEDNIDWSAVAKAYEGFKPAFVAEAANRSQRFAMAENGGLPKVANTEDLILAAQSLRPQLELMEGAKEGVVVNTLDDAMRTAVEGVAKRTSMAGRTFHVEPATVLNGGRQ